MNDALAQGILPGEARFAQLSPDGHWLTMLSKGQGAFALELVTPPPGPAPAWLAELADAVERQVTVRPDGEEVVETVNGTLDLNNFSETINGLNGYGTINNVAAATAASERCGPRSR